ncbi:MAG: twin-arginine translocase subunit TatC [Actinomycetota bacterium]
MRVIPRRRRSDEERSGTMTLLDHLGELRHRLIICLIALAVCAIPGWFLYEPLKEALRAPYCDFVASNPSLVPLRNCDLAFMGVIDGFTTKMKMVVYIGLVIALPVILYQLWMFIMPGLTPRERRYAVPFVASSLILFVTGGIFAYLVLPRGLQFLLGFAGEGVGPILTFDKYFGFVVLVLLAFGVSFLLPVLLVFLEAVGVLTPQLLASWRRWAFLGIFVFAAIITPSADFLTLFALAIPMYLFYEAAIIIGRLLQRQRTTD